MSSNTPPIRVIQSTELLQTIQDTKKAPGKDYLVVDVRDDDYEGGNIPNSVNVPSASFRDNVDQIISQYSQVPKIVFTCALSQSRGPKCARIYKEILEEKAIKTDQKVEVLKGGFIEWARDNKNDPKLVEKYDEERWNEEYL